MFFNANMICTCARCKPQPQGVSGFFPGLQHLNFLSFHGALRIQDLSLRLYWCLSQFLLWTGKSDSECTERDILVGKNAECTEMTSTRSVWQSSSPLVYPLFDSISTAWALLKLCAEDTRDILKELTNWVLLWFFGTDNVLLFNFKH